MVSFSCENCGDVLTKKKLDQHRGRCRGATFTCLDCMVHFPGLEYRSHTSCITEDQKYQGALYKDKKQKGPNKKQPTGRNAPNMNTNAYLHSYPHPYSHAYVEDVPEEYQTPAEDFDQNSPVEILPEAPTPPSALAEPAQYNVFDFLVEGSATAHASRVNFAPSKNPDGTLVTYDQEADAYVDPAGYMVDDDNDALVQYGTGPVPAAAAVPPPAAAAPAAPAFRTPRKASPAKKDKKRKRLHVEVGDHVMTDAPPVLHSGLTGGLSRMMHFPPSPEFSGGDNADNPASPSKKTKHRHGKSKSSGSGNHSSSKSDGLGSGLLALVGGGASKPKKRKVAKKHSHSHSRSSPDPARTGRHRRTSDGSDKSEKRSSSTKLIEFLPGSRNGEPENHQMVLYRPRADLFLSLVNKGPESERGCSVNKALKRFHRERSASATRERGPLSKTVDEKELWRSLRLRKNDRGEIVLFALDDQ